MNLQDIRREIDEIDSELIELYKRRMNCSRQVAEYKIKNGMPVFNPEREEQVLDSVEEHAGKYGASARQLYSTIMALSRSLQYELLGSGEALRRDIENAADHIPFNSSDIKPACFGMPETYTHHAVKKIFPESEPVFYPTFSEVFDALSDNETSFAVLPIENSSAGSVTEVYDLLLKHRYYIVACIELPVKHCLAALPGTSLEDISTVVSHPQALSQCSDFVRSMGFSHTAYTSTAASAERVSEGGNKHQAAICSPEAAEKYGLTVLCTDFQNSPLNATRFIVISRRLYIDPCADRISLCFSLPHKTGSLYSILLRFAANGLNLTKLESRPIADKPFEYCFYLDFIGSAKDPSTRSLLCALSVELTDFSFLGCARAFPCEDNGA